MEELNSFPEWKMKREYLERAAKKRERRNKKKNIIFLFELEKFGIYDINIPQKKKQQRANIALNPDLELPQVKNSFF